MITVIGGRKTSSQQTTESTGSGRPVGELALAGLLAVNLRYYLFPIGCELFTLQLLRLRTQ